VIPQHTLCASDGTTCVLPASGGHTLPLVSSFLSPICKHKIQSSSFSSNLHLLPLPHPPPSVAGSRGRAATRAAQAEALVAAQRRPLPLLSFWANNHNSRPSSYQQWQQIQFDQQAQRCRAHNRSCAHRATRVVRGFPPRRRF
jgi:hypothetical protein